MAIEIDLGIHGVQQPAQQSTSNWRPPRHVYFGPRDPLTGAMLEEPVYVHQEYPRLYYKQVGDKIRAHLVKSDDEKNRMLAEGWVKQPGELGYIGAPTLEDSVRLAEEAALAEANKEEEELLAKAEVIKRRPGRPKGS